MVAWISDFIYIIGDSWFDALMVSPKITLSGN